MFKKLNKSCLLFEKSSKTKSKKKRNILITGKNSFVGSNVRNYLKSHGYSIDELNVHGDEWKKKKIFLSMM